MRDDPKSLFLLLVFICIPFRNAYSQSVVVDGGGLPIDAAHVSVEEKLISVTDKYGKFYLPENMPENQIVCIEHISYIPQCIPYQDLSDTVQLYPVVYKISDISISAKASNPYRDLVDIFQDIRRNSSKKQMSKCYAERANEINGKELSSTKTFSTTGISKLKQQHSRLKTGAVDTKSEQIFFWIDSDFLFSNYSPLVKENKYLLRAPFRLNEKKLRVYYEVRVNFLEHDGSEKKQYILNSLDPANYFSCEIIYNSKRKTCSYFRLWSSSEDITDFKTLSGEQMYTDTVHMAYHLENNNKDILLEQFSILLNLRDETGNYYSCRSNYFFYDFGLEFLQDWTEISFSFDDIDNIRALPYSAKLNSSLQLTLKNNHEERVRSKRYVEVKNFDTENDLSSLAKITTDFQGNIVNTGGEFVSDNNFCYIFLHIISIEDNDDTSYEVHPIVDLRKSFSRNPNAPATQSYIREQFEIAERLAQEFEEELNTLKKYNSSRISSLYLDYSNKLRSSCYVRARRYWEINWENETVLPRNVRLNY